MIHHLDIAVGDIGRSRAFYARALAALGLEITIEFTSHSGCRVIGFGAAGDPAFWIREGGPVSGPLHVAFLARARSEVDAFHSAALQAGASDNGAPGLRPRYGAHWYAAFVRDPDGHNLEAVCREAGP